MRLWRRRATVKQSHKGRALELFPCGAASRTRLGIKIRPSVARRPPLFFCIPTARPARIGAASHLQGRFAGIVRLRAYQRALMRKRRASARAAKAE